MTFEEFFKKKKINLQTLEQGEPSLFSEFKIHFNQMGEKSFDHTKKYWFNKLRLRFPTPPEIKTEKVIMENRLAEQTIIESLVESSTPSPTVGFKPKFRAGLTKPVEAVPEEKKEDTPAEQPVVLPAVGFKPRFKAGAIKPAEATPPEEKKEEARSEQSTTTLAVGFKPRFKAGVTKPAESVAEEKKEETETPIEESLPKPTVGFKPRFKAGVTKPIKKDGEDYNDNE